MEDIDDTTVAMRKFELACRNHLEQFLKQVTTASSTHDWTHSLAPIKELLLRGVKLSFREILLPLLKHIVEKVRPLVHSGDRVRGLAFAITHLMRRQMDIRKYLKIKTLPGGDPTQSAYYSGVVFNKNITHKKMRKEITFGLHIHRLA